MSKGSTSDTASINSKQSSKKSDADYEVSKSDIFIKASDLIH